MESTSGTASFTSGSFTSLRRDVRERGRVPARCRPQVFLAGQHRCSGFFLHHSPGPQFTSGPSGGSLFAMGHFVGTLLRIAPWPASAFATAQAVGQPLGMSCLLESLRQCRATVFL